MNRFISTKEALDTLSVRAPRAWCKKMLLALMFEGSLTAYAGGGHLLGRVPVLVLLDDDKIIRSDGAKFWSAVEAKYGPVAHKKEDIKESSRGSLFQITGARWSPENVGFGSHAIGFGYFYYADSLDWEAGTLSIDSLFPNECWQELFKEDDTILSSGGVLDEPRYSWLEYEIHLTDLCFERSAIEMLTGLDQPAKPILKQSGGRPAKWDWEGAIAQVAAIANKPDGIPTDAGAQARIARLITEWFMKEAGEAPADSEVRKRAATIIKALTRR